MVKANKSTTMPLHTPVVLNICQCFPSINQENQTADPLTKIFHQICLSTLPSHTWTVTQDALGRECEIYVALRHLRYNRPRIKVVFLVQIHSLRSRGIHCGVLM
jgi:hypothetical protein